MGGYTSEAACTHGRQSHIQPLLFPGACEPSPIPFPGLETSESWCVFIQGALMPPPLLLLQLGCSGLVLGCAGGREDVGDCHSASLTF